MKKVLICGILLGLLPTLALAQRGRVAGGVGPASRTIGPTSTVGPMTTGTVGPMTSTGRINSNTGPATLSHGGMAPSTKPVGTTTTVAPSTDTGKTIDSVGTNTKPVPNRTIPPDTGTIRPDTGVGPDR
jgi:hypothetical protein